MTVIIKRNGEKEKFDEAKLRRAIAAAANEADLPVDRCQMVVAEVTNDIAADVAGKKEVRAVEMRELILARLDKVEPRVACSWRDYDRESKGLA
jgi:transcriptional regulator NrdR family protein